MNGTSWRGLTVCLSLVLGLGLSACGHDVATSAPKPSSKTFCRAYRHIPDDVPLRRQEWAWAAQVARVEPPSDMPDDAVRGIAVAERVYRARAKGRVIGNYDLPAMRAFEAFGNDRCGKPAGEYELDVKVLD